MAKIVIIDDDYSTELLVEHLHFRGHQAKRFKSADLALAGLDEIASADLVVLDVIMEFPAALQPVGISGDRHTGITLLHTFRDKNPDLRVLVFSATSDMSLIDAVKQTPNTCFLPKWDSPSLKEFLIEVERLVGKGTTERLPRCFIVHGHDETEKLALKNYLQNTLKLPEPIILHEQPSLGRTVIEKLENEASLADVVFVLLTPDDRIAGTDGTNDEKRRARQNVIFELGYFLGVFGRLSGCVFLHKGQLDLPSDLGGVIYIDITHGINAASEVIRRELSHVI